MNAQKALHGLGFYKLPAYGMTPYPDEPLFEAIEGFQRRHGLKVDGVMKPGGETARTMDAVLTKNNLPAPRKPATSGSPAVGGLLHGEIPEKRTWELRDREAAADNSPRNVWTSSPKPRAGGLLWDGGKGEGKPFRPLAERSEDVAAPAPAPSHAQAPAPPPREGRHEGPGNSMDDGNPRYRDFYRRLEAREGKEFTNRSNDRGGPTKLGVTWQTLKDYHAWKKERNETVDIPNDVKELTSEQAKRIYREFYHDRYRVGEIDDPDLAEHLFDINVNPGPGRSARWAQEALNDVARAGLEVDGVMGSKTIAALNRLEPEQRPEVMSGIAARRESFYKKIVRDDPLQQENIKGWINRVKLFQN